MIGSLWVALTALLLSPCADGFLQSPQGRPPVTVSSRSPGVFKASPLFAATESSVSSNNNNKECFDMDVALFCGGLAFDAYVEPAANSSRWERGSRGWKVAFCSPAFTRSLYTGLLQVTVQKITDLPKEGENDNAAEQVLTGWGIDACLLVAVLEGSWKDDVALLEKEQFHEGVLELTGAAHVGRSRTAWSNVDEKASQGALRRGDAKPYHVPASWGKGGQAIWPEQPLKDATLVDKKNNPLQHSNSFYLYVQDPATARLVFTVGDDNRIGEMSAIGSTYERLAKLIPRAANSPERWMEDWKKQVLQQHVEEQQKGTETELPLVDLSSLQASWEGESNCHVLFLIISSLFLNVSTTGRRVTSHF
jgi:hypothetical protein